MNKNKDEINALLFTAFERERKGNNTDAISLDRRFRVIQHIRFHYQTLALCKIVVMWHNVYILGFDPPSLCVNEKALFLSYPSPSLQPHAGPLIIPPPPPSFYIFSPVDIIQKKKTYVFFIFYFSFLLPAVFYSIHDGQMFWHRLLIAHADPIIPARAAAAATGKESRARRGAKSRVQRKCFE